MEYFDSHMHLDDEKFDKDREEIIKKIYSAGVTKCICIGTNVETTKKAIQIANANNFVYASSGLHPEDIPQNEDEMWKSIDEIESIYPMNEFLCQYVDNKGIEALDSFMLDYDFLKDNGLSDDEIDGLLGGGGRSWNEPR